MFGVWNDIRAADENYYYEWLCEKCRKRVEDGLDTGIRFFDKSPKEWKFCKECMDEIENHWKQEKAIEITQFRAWDLRKKRMFKVASIEFAAPKWKGYVGGYVKDSRDIDYSFTDIILMQSTGLKDKKGIEIFEGDIVNFEGCLWKIAKDRMFLRMFLEGKKGVRVMEINMSGIAEIVGDIHEDPELLTVPLGFNTAGDVS